MSNFPKTLFMLVASVCISAGAVLGKIAERDYGRNARYKQDIAAQLDDCARKENVYPTSCQMQAVVIKPRLLKAPRVEGAGHE